MLLLGAGGLVAGLPGEFEPVVQNLFCLITHFGDADARCGAERANDASDRAWLLDREFANPSAAEASGSEQALLSRPTVEASLPNSALDLHRAPKLPSGGKLATLAALPVPELDAAPSLVAQTDLGARLAALNDSSFGDGTGTYQVAQALPQSSPSPAPESETRTGGTRPGPPLRVVESTGTGTTPAQTSATGTWTLLKQGVAFFRNLGTAPIALGTAFLNWLLGEHPGLDPAAGYVTLDDDNGFHVVWLPPAWPRPAELRVATVTGGNSNVVLAEVHEERGRLVAQTPDGIVVATKGEDHDHWTIDVDELRGTLGDQIRAIEPMTAEDLEQYGLPMIPGKRHIKIGKGIYFFDPQTGELRLVAIVGSSPIDPNTAVMSNGGGGGGSSPGPTDDGDSESNRREWRDGRYRSSVLPESSDLDDEAKREGARLKVSLNDQLRALWSEPADSLVLDLIPSTTPGHVEAEAPPTHLSVDEMNAADARARLVESARLMQDTYLSQAGTPIPGGVGIPRGAIVPHLDFGLDAYFGDERGIVTATDPIGLAPVRGTISSEPKSTIRPRRKNPRNLSRRGKEVYETFVAEDGGWEAATLRLAFTQVLQAHPQLRDLVPTVEIATLDEEGNTVLAMPHPGTTGNSFVRSQLEGDAKAHADRRAGEVFALATQAIGANEKGVRDLPFGTSIAVDVGSLHFTADGEPVAGWWLTPIKVTLGRLPTTGAPRPSSRTGFSSFPARAESNGYLAYPSSVVRDYVLEHTDTLAYAIRTGLGHRELESAAVRAVPGPAPTNVIEVRSFSNPDLLTADELPKTPEGGAATQSPESTATQQLLAVRSIAVEYFDAARTDAGEILITLPDGKTYIVHIAGYFDETGRLQAIGPIQLREHVAGESNIVSEAPGSTPTDVPNIDAAALEDRFMRTERDGTTLGRGVRDGKPVQVRTGPREGLEAIVMLNDYLFQDHKHDLEDELLTRDENDEVWGSEVVTQLPDPQQWQSARVRGEDVAGSDAVQGLREEWLEQLEWNARNGPISVGGDRAEDRDLIWVDLPSGTQVALRLEPIDEDHVWFDSYGKVQAYPLFVIEEIDRSGSPAAAQGSAAMLSLPDGSILSHSYESDEAGDHLVMRRTFSGPHASGKAVAIATVTTNAASAPGRLGAAIPEHREVEGDPATVEASFIRDRSWQTLLSEGVDEKARELALKNRRRFIDEVKKFMKDVYFWDLDDPIASPVRINEEAIAFLYDEEWNVVKALDLFVINDPSDAASSGERDDDDDDDDDDDSWTPPTGTVH